jgi:hypothetical protein
LIESPSFQLKPLNPNGRFYDIMKRIEQYQRNEQAAKNTIDINSGPDSTTIVIPMDSVLNFNFAEVAP